MHLYTCSKIARGFQARLDQMKHADKNPSLGPNQPQTTQTGPARDFDKTGNTPSQSQPDPSDSLERDNEARRKAG